jgi:uncharacterized protein YcbX
VPDTATAHARRLTRGPGSVPSGPMPRVARIYRYPVKGLSAERLEQVELTARETLPFDRAYAIENGPSGFDRSTPRHLQKTAFLMLMRNERLAELKTEFDDATQTLTVRQGGNVAAEGRLDTADGRRMIEVFFDRFSAGDLRGPARVLSAPGHSFADAARKVVSLINLATVDAIAETVGARVDPLRFRGNLYVDGLPAWEEFSWVARRLAAGAAEFAVIARIDRCAAINVDPETGIRDLAIPRSLLEAYGHADCGVYLEITTGGVLSAGDPIGPV